jgi:hypothetical protein
MKRFPDRLYSRHRPDGRARLINLDRIRTMLLGLVLVLLIGHSLFPHRVTIDGFSITLIAVASLLALAPTLTSAKLPGGTEFLFRQKIEAAEHLGSDVQIRSYKEGYTGGSPGWPQLIEIPDEVREGAIERPAEALADLRRALMGGLERAARGLASHRDRMPPESPPEQIEFIAKYGHVWPEQVALMRVILDVSNSSLLSGDVTAADALRVIAVADALNNSLAFGYSLNFDPNPEWEEMGLICQYEHCIEHMPVPGVPREEHMRWRERIRENLDRGFYDDHPERKHELEQTLSEPIPDYVKDHVDKAGACPVFGHYCPGGEPTVRNCEAAKEWIAMLQSHGADTE